LRSFWKPFLKHTTGRLPAIAEKEGPALVSLLKRDFKPTDTAEKAGNVHFAV
jgi:hypothetical protein